MKYKFYITDTFDGAIRGTDSEEVALDASHSEDYYVLNAETGQWIVDGEPSEVSEFRSEEEE